MLILTRKSNESVIIGNDIEVRILDVRGDQVSLGFTAPRKVAIYRKELYEAIQAQNRDAAGSSGGDDLNKLSKSLEKQLETLSQTP
jgi:carbon storage regulator